MMSTDTPEEAYRKCKLRERSYQDRIKSLNALNETYNRRLAEQRARLGELEQCIREASSYLLSGHGVGHLAQPCLQDMIDKMDMMERSNQ